MAHDMHAFANSAELANSLADRVAGALSAAISARGAASIAVSGGSTPKAFFQALATRALDWEKVTITLVDERFVPADNPRSNHLLVSSNLLTGKASAARFLPLYQDVSSVEKAAAIATENTRTVGCPFDVVTIDRTEVTVGLSRHPSPPRAATRRHRRRRSRAPPGRR